MTLSFVLRLVPSALSEGRIAGQAQAVENGETAQLRNADELIAFLLAAGHKEPLGTPDLGLPGPTAQLDDPDGSPGEMLVARLSPAEASIVRLVAEGCSNKQIAAQLVVSLKTVEYHLSNLYRRLGFTSRVKLAQLASLAA